MFSSTHCLRTFTKNLRFQKKVFISGTAIVFSATAYASLKDNVKAAQIASTIDLSKFMHKPITALSILEKDQLDMKNQMELLIMKTQADVCRALEAEEESGKKFLVDKWDRKKQSEGGGITCVLQGGDTFEKAGVNITVIKARLSKKLQESMKARGKDLPLDQDYTFFAAGVSSVIHPKNPHIPTMHFNYRYFEVQDEKGKLKDWWFGGGTDLTPYYLDEDDVNHFHSTLKNACDTYSDTAYQKYKKWCDKYFFITHRGEARGVGGIFFDDLESSDPNQIFSFVKKCCSAVNEAYIPLVKKNKNKLVLPGQRDWQLLRRGRYVEFNLVIDRGTKFGFATQNARIESILMSMPLLARWEYMYEPAPGSPEAELQEVLKNPKEWL